MTPEQLAALDAVIAALEAHGQASAESGVKARAGESARRAATADAGLMALMTPGIRGAFVGPWLQFTCPKGHKILRVRAETYGPEQGVTLTGGRLHLERTSRAAFIYSEAAATPLFGPMPDTRGQGSALTGRRVWTCPAPKCSWSAPISEEFLLRLYAETAKRGLRRVPLAPPAVC